MTDDLLEPRAAVDWAIAQLEVTERRIETWRKECPYELFTYFDPEMGKKAIKHSEPPLPLIINAEAGAIVNSIRSSLDILAVALAARNGFVDSKDTYFPICGSVNDFIDPLNGGLKKINRLSAQDRATIEHLRPYHGGNDMLYALHQMDIMRKHRKLLAVHVDKHFSLTGYFLDPIWAHELPPEKRPKDKTLLVWVGPDSLETHGELTVKVTLTRGEALPPAPVVPALREFCSLAYSVISLFE